MNSKSQHQGVSSEDKSLENKDKIIGSEDEINLFVLIKVILDRWKLVLLVTLFMTLIAVGLSFLMQNNYKAEAILLPPLVSDIEYMNIVSAGKGYVDGELIEIDAYGRDKITVDKVYAEALINLKSVLLRRLFFDDKKVYEFFKNGSEEDQAEDVFRNQFHQVLRVEFEQDNPSVVLMSLQGTDPVQIASWLNEFISFVNTYTINQYVKNIETKVSLQEKHILETMDNFRLLAKKKRYDRIAVLEEALAMANSLNIVNGSQALEKSDSINTNLNIDVNTVENPLYLRGVRALQAEIDVLKKRSNDDSFDKNIRNMQLLLSQLRDVKISTEDIKVFRIDQQAMVPQHPHSPNRVLIILIGSILGFTLGIFASYFLYYIEYYNKCLNSNR